MKIRAAVTATQGQPFDLKDVELASPKGDEILVRVVATGVCHTDAAARDLGIAPYPIVLGHEGAGVVEQIGDNVRDMEVGDHVVLSFAHCGHCSHCLTGHPTVCERGGELNFGGVMDDGGKRLSCDGHDVATFFGQSSFATHAVVSERNAVKVDSDVDLALLGPLGCGIQTGAGTILNRLKPGFGDSLVVFGCGAAGLSAVMAAKIAGCKNIIAVDLHESRLELAHELGATHSVNGKTEDLVGEIKRITDGGSEFSLETTGVPMLVRSSLQVLRPLGTSAIVGLTHDVTLDVHHDLMAEGKSMIGVIEGDAVPRVFIPRLVGYYKEGRFPFDKLIQMYDFDDIEQAFADSKSGLTVKPVLRISSL